MLGNFDEYAGGATHNNYTTTGTLMSDLTVAGFQGYFVGVESYTNLYGNSSLSTTLANTGTAASETLTGSSGMDGIYGFAGSDTISGLDGNDYLDGGSGDDILNGGNGNDFLFGGAGDDLLDGSWDFDTLDGGSGVDTADYRFFNFDTRVDLVTGRVDFPSEWSAGGQFDTLISIENIMTGSGNDTTLLSTDNINNVVNGGAGTDTVYVPYSFNSGYTVSGTASNLVMSGWAGVDTFASIELVHFSDNSLRSTSSLLGGATPHQKNDFNADSNSDILFHNAATGSVYEWEMNGRTIKSSGGLGGDHNWIVAGVGDFNGDG